MMKWMTITLALTVALVGALVLAQGGDEGHAATKSRVTSVFGVKETQAGDLIIHISALVPPGVDERVVADAALNAAMHGSEPYCLDWTVEVYPSFESRAAEELEQGLLSKFSPQLH